MNDNVMSAEARRRAMALAAFCKENAALLPLDMPFPGLRIRVSVERITSKDDTQPLRSRAEESIADMLAERGLDE